MFVKHWMVKDPVTILANEPLDRAFQMMKEKGISRLPVVNHQNHVIGMLTKGDCLRVSPSPASTLSKQEANYLLGKLKVSEVMSPKILSTNPNDHLEDVAVIMKKYKIEGLPVVESGKLVGIITKSDIFDAFMDIMGAGSNGTRLILESEDQCGVLSDVSQLFKKREIVIDSVAKIHRNEHHKVYLLLRYTATLDKQEALLKELEEHGYRLDAVMI